MKNRNPSLLASLEGVQDHPPFIGGDCDMSQSRRRH